MFTQIACKLVLLLTIVCVVYSTGYTDDESTRFVIRGPQRVTDGWISLDSASFGDPELVASGSAWSNYWRVLVKFNLGEISPARYGRVERAILRLHATQAANGDEHETTVAAVAVPWTTDATWSTRDGNNAWPQKQHSNIDYAMVVADSLSRVITEPGVVQFDVTNIVDAWLYQGAQNNGFLIRTGETIFGKPGAGTWQLVFASSEADEGGPELVVELAGTVPTPEEAHERALALYPSPLLPPVKDPYLFAWYPLDRRDLAQRLVAANLTTYSSQETWLYPRGVMNLGWGEGGPAGWLATEEAWVGYYVGLAERYPMGYCMHEWHMSSDSPDAQWAVAAVREAERRYPESYSAFYYQGQEEMAKLAAEGVLDLLILQGYTNVHKQFGPISTFAIGMGGIKQRIDVAREAGALERTIVMLGHICKPDDYHPGYELTAEMVDQQIAELRAYAPEMPGIAFYFVGGDELAVQCDELARKHFVDPAPEVLIAEPAFAAELTATHVTVRAEAQAKGERTVRQYRWFIDNRLVAETEQPSYVWDLRGEANGYHFITVHAVDSAYNRAAAQVLVTIAR